jgi:hypothetical protein
VSSTTTTKILETDSSSVVSKLNNEMKDMSMLGPLVEDIKRELREMVDYKVKWARPTANRVAHVLAKEGCGLEICKTWFIIFPDCIGNLLTQDVHGWELIKPQLFLKKQQKSFLPMYFFPCD